jgi:NTP pyrophosphatase (non-canonical NTP hydrolase)
MNPFYVQPYRCRWQEGHATTYHEDIQGNRWVDDDPEPARPCTNQTHDSACPGGRTSCDGSQIVDSIRSDIWTQDILGERRAQDERWGDQSHHPDLTWFAILTEEVGEVAQSILHDEFGGKAAGTLRAELVQVVTVGVAWLEAIDRRALGGAT